MTRLLHVSDLHFGMVTHSQTDPATGLPSRLLDVARCWRTAAELAVERGVDAMIVAGDTFHGPNPDAPALTLFAEGLRVLRTAKIATLVISGNHDRAPHPGRSPVITVFEDLPYVRTAHQPGVVDVGGIKVACLPSVSRHQLVGNRGGIARSAADEQLVEGLVRTLDWLRTEDPDVLTLHWPIQGSVLGNEKDLAIIPEPMLGLADVEGPWRYVAAGHIHKAQRLGSNGQLGWYAGSIDRMNFGEESEEKVAIDVDLSLPAAEECRLPARRFLTREIEAFDDFGYPDGHPDEDVEGAVVRVRFGFPEGERPDTAPLEAELYAAGAHRVVIDAEPVRSTPRGRAADVTEDLSTDAALDRWFELRGVEQDERGPVRQLARDLMLEAP